MKSLGLFTDKKFYKKLLTLGIPIALQQLMYSVFGVIDTAMIAQLGADSTAGVGAASRWMFMLVVTCVGLIAATTSLISQYWGIKDYHNIRKATGLSLFFGMSIGLVFSLCAYFIPDIMIGAFTDDSAMISQGAKYLKMISFGTLVWSFNYVFSTALKSMESVRITLVSSIISILFNVFFNWVFIFGNLGAPAMGVEGAALGTVISYFINLILLIGLAKIKDNPILHQFKQYFDIDRVFFKKFTKIMTPAVINEILWVLGNMTYSVVLGRYGNANYGAYTLFNNVEFMFFTFFIGLSSAGSILIGKDLGRGNIERGWNHALKNIILAPIFAVFLGAILILLRYPILNLMRIPDPYMVDMTAKLLLYYAIASPVRVIPFMTIVGIFRSGGDTMSGLWIDILNVWFVGVPITLLAGFVFKAPFELVFLAMFTEDIVKVVMCLVVFFRKKWLVQLTHDSELFRHGSLKEGKVIEEQV
jgi:putative MATE family efflux protein